MVHNITNHNNKKYTWCNIVLKFVSDLRQVGGFLWVLGFLHQ
jgi:hypothetical protein